MSLGLALGIRNTRLNSIRDAVDAGGSAGKLCIYSGDRPYTGGPAGEKLAEFTLSHPCAMDAEDGMLVLEPVEAVNASASGKAKWARVLTSRQSFVFDCSVGVGTGEVQLKSADLYEGMKVTMTSGSLTEGNG